ncbi:origin recognition complex subunit 2 isoform X2 [Planococcus citri]|uniref:origin recognition complex subunit 2 isoform X2 n=1 Tax=Planococcus citri TaxID=170843 RepID=UPI0031F93E39
MSKNERKKVEVQFVSDDQVCKNVSLDSPDQPIAKRTRNQVNCSSASKSRSRTSTPTLRKSIRHGGTPKPKYLESPNDTPPRNSRCRFSTIKNDERPGSPVVVKAVKAGCSSEEGKVTPLKIVRRSSPTDHTPSDEDFSGDVTPKVDQKRPSFVKSETLRSSSRIRNTPKLEKESVPSINGCRTPKTPRYTTGDCLNTPHTRSTARTLRNASTTPGTPSVRKTLNFNGINELTQTPYRARRKLKKKIQTVIREVEEDKVEEDDTESLDSEYSANDSQSESDDEGNKFDSDYESTPAKRNRLSTLRKNEISSPSTLYRITPQKKIAYQNEVRLDSEGYFERKSLKNITSSNVLSKLPLPEISDIKISSNKYVKHEHEINSLMTKHTEQFTKWLLYLKEGFNLMLFGVGSKIEILKQFHKDKLSNSYVLRVNGFNNNFSINEMIKTLMKEILDISHCPANVNEALDITLKELKQYEIHVFIIINNIDGVALRGAKKQTILSKLAESPFVHIIASLDHINAPLLWGNSKMSCFNFIWLDVTTFDSYATEISYQKSIDIEPSGSDPTLELLNKVFNWQDQRTKEVFELIVKDFLNKNKKNFKGTLTSELLRTAVKNLSISSKSALLSSLKAFIEHDIIHVEHNYLKFLIHPNVVRSFYKQHFS